MEQSISWDSEPVFLILYLTRNFENVLFLVSSEHLFKLFTRAVRNGVSELKSDARSMAAVNQRSWADVRWAGWFYASKESIFF